MSFEGRQDEGTPSSSFSSSSSFRWSYDVFLSYRGTDSKNFTGHLINNLRQKGLTVFKDDEFERGDFISPVLDSAIEGSRASIIVLSTNYAESKWCLNELVKILECRELNQQSVTPIFYKVDPSVVRNQRERYGEAMVIHERKFRDQLEKVEKWREALRTAANLSGWAFAAGSYEPDFIQKIAEEVSRQLANRAYLHEAEHPVGLKSRVCDLNSILDAGKDKDDVRLVVVYGPEGIGKTTIAKAAYNSYAHHFQGSSFLANVSENLKQHFGVVQLQKILLSEILRETNLEVGNIDKGITLIKNRLWGKRVLLVLDDVNSLNELHGLAGKSDWFGKGSRIMVTTREKSLINFHNFPFRSAYEVKSLDDHEALKLFCWNAFRNEAVSDGYVELAERAVQCTEGFPFKLIELGSCLHGKHRNEWNGALESYQRNQSQKAKGKDVSPKKHHDHHSSALNKVIKQKVDEELDLPSSSTRNSLSMENYKRFQQTNFRENKNVKISLDNNRKICCMLSARELSIDWSHESRFWSWISLPNSRFAEVSKLNEVYHFNIEGKIETMHLSTRTTYVVYFVFKFEAPIFGFTERAINFTISCGGSKGGGKHITFFSLPENASVLCKKREDGWMEFIMGEFFINDGDNGEIWVRLMEHDTSVRKTGLIIEGIDFRPKVDVELDLSSLSTGNSLSIAGYVYLFQHTELMEKERVIISQDNNGKNCCLLSARELLIDWSDDPRYWSWISLPNSRFSKVAKLNEVYHLDIQGRMETKNLSSRTTYTIYFVFKFESLVSGFKERPVEMIVNYEKGNGGGGQSFAFLDPSKVSPEVCRKREDGWMEINMGELFIHGEYDSEIKIYLMEHDTCIRKSGLIVGGVEFRPKWSQ